MTSTTVNFGSMVAAVPTSQVVNMTLPRLAISNTHNKGQGTRLLFDFTWYPGRSWSRISNHDLLTNCELPQTNMLVMLLLLFYLLLIHLVFQIGLNQIKLGANASTQEEIARCHITGCIGS